MDVKRLEEESESHIGGSRLAGKILVNCAYCFAWKLSCDTAAPLRVLPVRVTLQL